MYLLGKEDNAVIVSDSHLVKWGEEWIRVSSHPLAKKIETTYDKPFLYCFNTSSHIIPIQDFLFSDWDETVIEKSSTKQPFVGFNKYFLISLEDGSQKIISDIQIGDVLEKGITVTGVVESINNENIYFFDLGIHENILERGCSASFLNNLVKDHRTVFHLLTNTQDFYVKGNVYSDYNGSSIN